MCSLTFKPLLDHSYLHTGQDRSFASFKIIYIFLQNSMATCTEIIKNMINSTEH